MKWRLGTLQTLQYQLLLLIISVISLEWINPVLRTHLPIEIWPRLALLNEDLHQHEISIFGGIEQRGPTTVLSHVTSHAVLDQQSGDGQVVALNGLEQGSSAIVIRNIQVH